MSEGKRKEIEQIDPELCELHPLVRRMRFEDSYDTAGLEESIRKNGQVQPAVATMSPDGKTPQIIVGWRRCTATRNINRNGDNKNKRLDVVIMYGLTDEQIIRLALAENLKEREERRDISTLEMISYAQTMLQMYGPKEFEEILAAGGYKRETSREIVEFAEHLDMEKIAKLHAIEEKENAFNNKERLHAKEKEFSFELRHLDFLQQVGVDGRKLFQTAALIAYTRKPLREVKLLAAMSSYFAGKIPWFKEFFSDYTDREEEEAQEEGQPSSLEQLLLSAKGGEGAMPEEYIVLKCYYCRLINPFKVKGQLREFVFFALKEDGTVVNYPIEAYSLDFNQRKCGECGEAFWVRVAVVPQDGGEGKQRIVAGTSEKMETSLPKEDAVIRKLYWHTFHDNKKAAGWVSYDSQTGKKFVLEKDGSETELVEEHQR